MHWPFEVLIGLRYLRAKRRNGFISFISLISIVGIALGVAVLVAVVVSNVGFSAAESAVPLEEAEPFGIPVLEFVTVTVEDAPADNPVTVINPLLLIVALPALGETDQV